LRVAVAVAVIFLLEMMEQLVAVLEAYVQL
jgi:hypothetical protein